MRRVNITEPLKMTAAMTGGKELFAVRYDPTDGAVYAEVVAFSRHGTWWSRLGSPVTAFVQRVVTNRYVRAV